MQLVSNNFVHYEDSVLVIVPEIQGLFVEMENVEQESDNVSQPSEHENDEGGDGENNGNNGVESQRDAEQHIGQSNDDTNAAISEQHAASQGQDQNDDVQMTTEDGDNNVADEPEPGDTENVQPQDAALLSSSTSVVPLPPAPIEHQTIDNSNTNQAKQCFKCVETFIQESAYIDHLVNFHGIQMQNDSTPKNDPKPKNDSKPIDQKKPGQFVLNPKKRKHLIPVEDIENVENPNNRVVKRKSIKKTPLAQVN